jgi:cyclopropane fatty-acyl-phospholipid synthase-like methyltransferase
MDVQNIFELSGRARHRQQRRAQIITFYLKPSKENVVLDIGCAEGFVTSYFLKAGFVIGLELSEDSLKIAK